MLQTVRKYTQGWVATVMGIILTIAFMLWGIENYVSGSSKKQVAAKVNGKEITNADVNNDFQRLLLRLKDQAGSNFGIPALMQQELKQQALTNLIIQTVLAQSALKNGFRISQQETSAAIKQMPAFQEENHFSRTRFNSIIARMGYTQQEFFSDVSNSLLLNQVASGLIGTEFTLPYESNQAITLLEQKRDIVYALIPLNVYKKNAVISSSQINAFYERYKNKFKIPAKVQIEYIQLAADNLKNTVQVTPQELNQYFDANSNLDKQNPKAIKTAEEAVRQQKLEQAFLVATDKLTDLTYTHPNSLAEAATALGLRVITSDYFAESGGNTAVTKNMKVIAAAFNSDILKERSNSNLIEIAPGNLVVIRVKDYKSETIAPLEDVKEKIKHTLSEADALAKTKQKTTMILQKLKRGVSFNKLIAEEHLQLVSKQNISRREKNINPDILRLAFSIAPSAKNPYAGTQLANGDCVIVAVQKTVNLPATAIHDEQRATINKLYADTYGKVDYHLYIQNQISLAKIKTYAK